MLQSYAVRLQMQWLSAFTMIISHQPQRVASCRSRTIAYESAALIRHQHREDSAARHP